jgi:integrase
MKPSEVRETTWGRVDFLNKSITASCAYSKNDETRTVPMTPDLERALSTVYNERHASQEDFLFLSDRDGKPDKSWRSAFKSALKKAGVSDFVFMTCGTASAVISEWRIQTRKR